MDGPPVRLFVMGANTWRDEEEWPLRRARMVDFYLDSDGSASSPNGRGSLIRTAPSGELPDHYTYDPRDPVMTLYNQNGHDEPHDLRLLDHRRDVLTYESDPLEKGMEVTGAPVMTLFASSSAPDTDFIVRLVDVHPDGFAQSLCYGIVRARFRNGFDNPEADDAGRALRVRYRAAPDQQPVQAGTPDSRGRHQQRLPKLRSQPQCGRGRLGRFKAASGPPDRLPRRCQAVPHYLAGGAPRLRVSRN